MSVGFHSLLAGRKPTVEETIHFEKIAHIDMKFGRGSETEDRGREVKWDLVRTGTANKHKRNGEPSEYTTIRFERVHVNTIPPYFKPHSHIIVLDARNISTLPVIMADSATASTPAAPAAAASPKKPKATSKKPRVKPAHPRTSEMVHAAIKNLKERGGSSLQAIKKYISANYKVDADKLAPFIKKYLKTAVTSGALVQTKGKGASGSFKLSSADKGGETKKPAAPAAAAAGKKSATKKPASKKSTAAAKPAKAKAPKKKASPAKPAKAPKSPSKAKKASKGSPTKKPKAPKPKKTATKPKAAAGKKAAPKKK